MRLQERLRERNLAPIVGAAVLSLLCAGVFIAIQTRAPEHTSPTDIRNLLSAHDIEFKLKEQSQLTGARLSPGKAVEFALQTFNALSPQDPAVYGGTIVRNAGDPEFTGPYYAFELIGLGGGPVLENAQPERFLLLIDASDGSRYLGFPLGE